MIRILISLWLWAYMRGEDHWLREHRRQADVEGNIVLVNEPASLSCYLVHHPRAKRTKRTAVVLADVAGVVANRRKNPVCWVWNEAMRPEVLRPRVEVGGEMKNRIAQLPTTKMFQSETKNNMHQQWIGLFGLRFSLQQVLWGWRCCPSCWTQPWPRQVVECNALAHAKNVWRFREC